MKAATFSRSVLAAAVAVCGSAAHAQDECSRQIQQVEQQLQQQQLEQGLHTEVQDLIRAAEQNPGDCNTYVGRAEELLERGRTGEQVAQQQDQTRQQTGRQQTGQQTAPQQGREDQQVTGIQVDEAPTEVDVQTDAPRIVVRQQPAKIKVIVEQQPPEVEYAQARPEVQVNQPERDLEVNQAEPNVEVSRSEPQVEVQYAEPEVEVVQREVDRTAQTAQQQTGQQQVARQQDQQQQVNLENVDQVVSPEGEEIAEVEEFVRSTEDDQAYVAARMGGRFGMGGRTVLIPLEELTLTGDGQLQTRLSRQEVEQMPAYDDEQNYEEIPQTEFAALESRLRGGSR